MRRSGSFMQGALTKRDSKKMPFANTERHSDGSLSLMSKIKGIGRGSKMGIGLSNSSNVQSLDRSSSNSSISLNDTTTTQNTITVSTNNDNSNNNIKETLLARVRKDNKRLLKELEAIETQAKDTEDLESKVEALRAEVKTMRSQRVSSAQHNTVLKAIKEEKAAFAVLQCEKDALETQLSQWQKKKKGKLFSKE